MLFLQCSLAHIFSIFLLIQAFVKFPISQDNFPERIELLVLPCLFASA